MADDTKKPRFRVRAIAEKLAKLGGEPLEGSGFEPETPVLVGEEALALGRDWLKVLSARPENKGACEDLAKSIEKAEKQLKTKAESPSE